MQSHEFRVARALGAAVIAIALLMAPDAALAQADWDGSDSVDWDAVANWVGGTTPVDGQTITIDTTAGDPPFTPTIDSFTSNTGLSFSTIFVGGTSGSDAALTILGGGELNSSHTTLGVIANSFGTATVAGAGSRWNLLGDLNVGLSGTGTLIVSDGGWVDGEYGFLGKNPGGMGSATVTGAGSQWLMSSDLYVGNHGNGALTISAGGLVDSSFGFVGLGPTGSGTVLITGTDSQWSTSSTLFVGFDGAGTVTVADGGLLDGTTGFVGLSTGSSGTVEVTGANSQWISTGSLFIGNSGTGGLTVSNGGFVSNVGSTLGNASGSSGTATVTGSGSQWQMSGDLNVGISGTADLTVSTGGLVNVEQVYLGVGSGSSGTMLATGNDSELLASSNLWVGLSGSGSMTVENGAAVANSTAYVGANNGGMGTVLVTGGGSTWSNSGDLFLGLSGIGDMTISDGGFVSSVNGNLGRFSDGTGTAMVTGAGSEWAVSSGIIVGNEGIGGLTIADGGVVNNQWSTLGDNSGSSGTATVTGTGSQWNLSSDLFIGSVGSGELTIADGGVVSNFNSNLGSNVGSSGSALVTGAGSHWNLGGNLIVGLSGTGEVIVEDGGTVVSGFSLIGSGIGGSGEFTVTGAGSQWSNSGLFLGNGSQGVLTVSDGGIVNVTSGGGTIDIAVQDVGILNIGSSSVDAATAPGELQAGLLNFGSGTGTLVFNHTDTTGTYTFAPNLASSFGTSAIDHYAGYTSLTGDGSSFAGTTTVYGGTLAVENMLGGMVDVMDGGTLGGSGDILGTINVGDGAILAPGSSIGTLDVVGDVTQAFGSTLAVEVDDAGNSDLLNVTGSYTIDSGATLDITPENGTDDGSTYAASTQYTIVTASTGVTGTFDTVTEDFFFLDATVDYDANNVFLTLAQIFDFVDAAITPNQMQTAGALDGLADGDPLKEAMLMILSEEDAQDAFGQLSGEIHPSLRGALRSNDGRALGAAQGRVRLALGAMDDEDAEPNDVFWATGFGNWRTTDATTNTYELGNDAYGIIAGIDRAMGGAMRLGLMGAYSRTDASQEVLRSDANADSYSAGIYGGTDDGRFVLDFGALYSWHSVDTTRRITNPLSETLTASYNARSVQLFGEAGFRIGANQVTATPFAGIAYGNVETDDFAEQGGDAALTAASESINTTFATLGVRPQMELAPNIRTRGMIGWRRALGDLDTDTTFSFDGVNQFSVTGAPLAEDSVVGEFGFDMFTAGGINFGASYVGQYGNGVSSNGFDLRLSTTF